jgi:hypothetical protein
MNFNGLSAEVSISNTYSGVEDIKYSTTSGNATTRSDTYTVPANKFWILKHYHFYRNNTGNMNISLNIDAFETAFVAVDVASNRYFGQMYDIKLKAGDSVKFNFLTGTSGNCMSMLQYEEYDV